MLASDGIPEGGISQPPRGMRVKAARIAAMKGERTSLTWNRMAFPLVQPVPKETGASGWFSELRCCMSAVARFRTRLPHKFTRLNDFMDLGTILRTFSRQATSSLRLGERERPLRQLKSTSALGCFSAQGV